MDVLISLIGGALHRVGFYPQTVHLSQLLQELSGIGLRQEMVSDQLEKRVFGLMEAGNLVREKLGGAALAQLAVLKVRELREASTGSPDVPSRRTAYILRSLKHPDEVKLLREVYGDSFFLVASYAPRDERIQSMADQIATSHHKNRSDDYHGDALKLILKDEEEPDNPTGQQVRKTFWMGDAFVDVSKPDDAKRAVERIFDLWFGSPYITPSRDEFAMFAARAAAYRSAAMGRQVGAAIATPEGSIIATGSNEVAKAGGGEYWEGDANDARDHRLGNDSSDTMRRMLLEDTLERLQSAGWTPPSKKPVSELALELVSHPALANAEVQSLIEYQRAVHGEMSALMDAALRGVSVKGCYLYATTFPCHVCARHIVAAGIARVVYIEPYAKSLVKSLYPDSISVDERCHDGRVRFEPFIGIAPRRYLGFFQMGPRKDKLGKAVAWKPDESHPRLNGWETWICVEKENKMLVEFRLLLQSGRISLPDPEDK